MDSSKKTISSLFNTIVVIILISSLPSSDSYSSHSNSEKVSVDLYYETLCPDSFDFILNHLVKLFHTGLVSIVDLKLSPYGNAKLRSNHTIVCQFYGTPISVSSLFLFWILVFAPRISGSDSGKVSLELYYESLCPYSANFVVNYLKTIFENDLISIVDLKLSPWGNARIRPNDTIVCQHGPNECLLNTIEACAIDAWPELNKHFPFIYCVEELVYERKYPLWESCFEKLSLDPKSVFDCYDSGKGKELELKYAAETDALQPPHKYVPWVVVNGQPLYEDYENFLSYICEAYKGTETQTGCGEVSHHTIKTLRAELGRVVVSYNDVANMTTLWGRVKSAVAALMSQA